MSYSKTIPLSWLRDNLWDPIASEPEKKDEILERVKDNLSSFEDDGIIVYLLYSYSNDLSPINQSDTDQQSSSAYSR